VIKTRFAPSPTGFIHIGNARTALFSALLGMREGSQFLLRIEDTDRDRSRDEFVNALQEDMWWLELKWHEGPVVGGDNGPYHQSEREPIYEKHIAHLHEKSSVYPCFCSESDLSIARKIQLSSGHPPRYSGKCAKLTAEAIQQKIAQGIKPTLRFRVPVDAVVEFDDVVRGKQTFKTNDIGDFIIRRGDNSTAFFFSNAVDDADMGVTHVLRGEDHLTNTPRQIMLLNALGLRVPLYGHISLIVGNDGSPLSKRHGSRSIRELRAEGYLPLAVVNYLGRLGHYYESDDLMPVQTLAAVFDITRLGKSPARYDAHQLLHWQQRALAASTVEELWEWMGPTVHALVPEARAQEFVHIIRGNVSFPAQAERWARIIFHDPLTLDDNAVETVAQAGHQFFQQANLAAHLHPANFKEFAEEVKKHTGAKGKALFMPLRAALTGELGGPEMAQIMVLMGPERVKQRLHACL